MSAHPEAVVLVYAERLLASIPKEDFDFQRATALLEDAVARHRAIGDRGSLSSAGLRLSLFLLGLMHREQGDFARATALFEACETPPCDR